MSLLFTESIQEKYDAEIAGLLAQIVLLQAKLREIQRILNIDTEPLPVIDVEEIGVPKATEKAQESVPRTAAAPIL